MIDRLAILTISPLALALSSTAAWLDGIPSDWVVRSHTNTASISSQTGEPFRLVRSHDGMYRTAVYINGKPMELIVDTGATRTILSESAARALGVRTAGKQAGLIRTFSGTVPLEFAQIDQLTIAGLQFSNVEAAIIAGADVSVMGLDWLKLIGPVRLDSID